MDAWMPKKLETKNGFDTFDVGALTEDEDEMEITIDSGAAKSVWPRKKNGSEKKQNNWKEAQTAGGEWGGYTSGR